MTDIADLERRVIALEAAQSDTTETLRWVVAKLGRISAIQDEHTLRLDRIDARLDRIDGRISGIQARMDRVEGRLDRVEGEIKGLRQEFRDFQTGLPSLIGDVMREVLKGGKTDGS